MLSCGPQESDATPRKSGRYNDVMFMRNRPGARSPQWLANRRKGNHLPGPTRCRAKGRVGSSKGSSSIVNTSLTISRFETAKVWGSGPARLPSKSH